MQDLDKFLVDIILWIAKEQRGLEDGMRLKFLNITCEKLMDIRDKLDKGEGDWKNSKHKCVIDALKNA